MTTCAMVVLVEEELLQGAVAVLSKVFGGPSFLRILVPFSSLLRPSAEKEVLVFYQSGYF